MKKIFGFCIALGMAACGPTLENDPVYQALKANPPTSIPAHHLKKLRGGRASCDVFEEGTARQYMTCWWPNGAGTFAYLSYYGSSNFVTNPNKLIAPGGEGITPYLPVN